MFLATIPAVIWVDNAGRKPILVSGAFIMAGCALSISLHLLQALTSVQLPYHCRYLDRLVPRLLEDPHCRRMGCMRVRLDLCYGFRVQLGPVRLDSGCRDLASEHSWKGCFHRCFIQLGTWYFLMPLVVSNICAQMNNFIVGQVTPTMMEHLGFGTFVFFGVSATLSTTFASVLTYIVPRLSRSSVASSSCSSSPKQRVLPSRRWTKSSAPWALLQRTTSARTPSTGASASPRTMSRMRSATSTVCPRVMSDCSSLMSVFVTSSFP